MIIYHRRTIWRITLQLLPNPVRCEHTVKFHPLLRNSAKLLGWFSIYLEYIILSKEPPLWGFSLVLFMLHIVKVISNTSSLQTPVAGSEKVSGLYSVGIFQWAWTGWRLIRKAVESCINFILHNITRLQSWETTLYNEWPQRIRV